MRKRTGRGPRPAWAAALLLTLAGCGAVSGPHSRTQDAGAVTAAQDAALAARCPARPPALQATDVDGTGDLLVPLRANRLLLCGYGYGHGTAGVVPVAVVVTRQADVEALRTAYDRLPTPPGGTFHCPMDNGSTILEVFTDGRHEVELELGVTGCQTVTNGAREGWVGSSDAVVRTLRLMPPQFCRSVYPTGRCP